MSTPAASEAEFAIVRRGYEPSAVRRFATTMQAQLAQERRVREELASEVAALRNEVRHALRELDPETLDERAREFVRQAQQEARALTEQAAAAAEDTRRAATEEATALRARGLAEVERLRVAAREQGEQIVAQASQQAAVLTERARQELAWSRRQQRAEQERRVREAKAPDPPGSADAPADPSAEKGSEQPVAGIIQTA